MKSESEQFDSLGSLREESDNLKQDLKVLERQNRELRNKLGTLSLNSGKSLDTYIRSQELQLAELIIENSPAILFRRLASDDPKMRKMVYVSPNISRFGYRAEDFLNGRVMFRDILYPGDQERTLIEIQAFVKKNIETYTQYYRIISSSRAGLKPSNSANF